MQDAIPGFSVTLNTTSAVPPGAAPVQLTDTEAFPAANAPAGIRAMLKTSKNAMILFMSFTLSMSNAGSRERPDRNNCQYELYHTVMNKYNPYSATKRCII